MKTCRGTTFSRLVLRHVFMCDYEKSCFRVILVQSKILFSCKIWGIKISFSVTVGIIDMKRKLYDSVTYSHHLAHA
mgnify:FL=1